jgi:translation initiation factor 1
MPQASCLCNASRHVNRGDTGTASDGIVRLHHERKGRKGKGVTLVKGLELSDAEIAGLAKRLKTGCGVGGAVKAGVIELQTSEREKIKVLLEAAGFTVKIAGG